MNWIEIKDIYDNNRLVNIDMITDIGIQTENDNTYTCFYLGDSPIVKTKESYDLVKVKIANILEKTQRII